MEDKVYDPFKDPLTITEIAKLDQGDEIRVVSHVGVNTYRDIAKFVCVYEGDVCYDQYGEVRTNNRRKRDVEFYPNTIEVAFKVGRKPPCKIVRQTSVASFIAGLRDLFPSAFSQLDVSGNTEYRITVEEVVSNE